MDVQDTYDVRILSTIAHPRTWQTLCSATSCATEDAHPSTPTVRLCQLSRGKITAGAAASKHPLSEQQQLCAG